MWHASGLLPLFPRPVFMCLILLALRAHPDYPLVVAANRDEYFARPTRLAEFWPESPQLLAGRDLQAGGSWLGINRRGRFAAVTNVRNGHDTETRPRSRGELVTSCLLSDAELTPDNPVLQQIAAHHHDYNGFNLLTGTPERLLYASNRAQDLLDAPARFNPTHAVRELQPGIYGLSNGGLDTPWPKVESGKALLGEILQRDWRQLEQRQQDLLMLLADDTQAPAAELPDTGVGAEREAILSARFIACPQDPASPLADYGTRASTLVLYHRSGRIHFLEHSFAPQAPRPVAASTGLRPALATREFVLES